MSVQLSKPSAAPSYWNRVSISPSSFQHVRHNKRSRLSRRERNLRDRRYWTSRACHIHPWNKFATKTNSSRCPRKSMLQCTWMTTLLWLRTLKEDESGMPYNFLEFLSQDTSKNELPQNTKHFTVTWIAASYNSSPIVNGHSRTFHEIKDLHNLMRGQTPAVECEGQLLPFTFTGSGSKRLRLTLPTYSIKLVSVTFEKFFGIIKLIPPVSGRWVDLDMQCWFCWRIHNVHLNSMDSEMFTQVSPMFWLSLLFLPNRKRKYFLHG